MKDLSDILFRGSIDHPRRVAIIFGQKKFTYDEVYKKAACLSSALRAEGVKKGDRVAVLLDNSPEFVFSYFGVLMSQAIVVPINHMLKRDEIKYILEDSGSSFLITSAAYAALAQELNVIVQTLKRVFYTNQKNEPLDIAENVLSQSEPQDIAVFLYTSGTTGHPKAAMLSHLNLIANCQSSSKAIRVSPKDTIICFLPLFHSFAATVCMLMPLSNGARMVILKSPKPIKKLLRSIRKNKVTIFVGIPSIYNILKDIKLPKFLPRPILRLFNPVRVAISGAAALPVEVFTKFEQKYGMPLLEGYGLTEASPVVSLNPLKGRRKPGSIGLPLPGVRIKITADDGSELGVEQIGELCCSGDNIMRGYFGKDEDNKTTLKDGWLLTGDMAKVDIEGYAYIMGRKKEMVNVRGLNVYPREIEEVLYLNSKIKEAAIIGIPDPHRGEAPKGFVVLKNAGSLSERDIISYLKEHLALYKIPKRIEIVEELPKNSSGKILKRVLLERSQLT